MNKQYISFPVYSLDEKTMQGLAELSEILEKVGVLVSVDRVERPGASAYDMFRLKVNEEQYRKITTRNAGRKQNFPLSVCPRGPQHTYQWQLLLDSLP